MDWDQSSPLHLACRTNDAKMVRELLKHDPKIRINLRDHLDRTPLLEACSWNRVAVTRILLQQPGIGVNAQDMHRNTSLHVVCGENHVELLRELLLHPNIEVNSRNRQEQTPLHLACLKNHLEVVRELLKHPRIEVNARDEHRWTPLHVACWYNHHQVMQELLGHPGLEVNSKTKNQDTPLHLTCREGRGAAGRELLKYPSVEVNSQDEDLDTPLHLVCYFRNFEFAQELLGHPNLKIHPENKRQETPLQMACKRNEPKIVRLLLGHLRTSAASGTLGLGVPSPLKKEDPQDAEVSQVSRVLHIITLPRFDFHENLNWNQKSLIELCQDEGYEEMAQLLTSFRKDPEETILKIRREDPNFLWDGKIFLLASLLVEGFYTAPRLDPSDPPTSDRSKILRFLGILQNPKIKKDLSLRMLLCRLILRNFSERFFFSRQLLPLCQKDEPTQSWI